MWEYAGESKVAESWHNQRNALADPTLTAHSRFCFEPGDEWRGKGPWAQGFTTLSKGRTLEKRGEVRRPQESHLAPETAEPLFSEPCGPTSTSKASAYVKSPAAQQQSV